MQLNHHQTGWNKLYEDNGEIVTGHSSKVSGLVDRLHAKGVWTVLDAGCGTGRHARFLAGEGFQVVAIDGAENAVKIAARQSNTLIAYVTGKLSELPLRNESVDFVLANHSLDYNNLEVALIIAREFDRVLKKGRPISVSVVSTQHPLCGLSPQEVYGFSHVGQCLQRGLPVHFYSEEELSALFPGYHIESLVHRSKLPDSCKVTIPLTEWVLFGYKQ